MKSRNRSLATRDALVECVVLGVASLITYLVVTGLLSRVGSVSSNDDLLGAMWAVIATIFVIRNGYGQSRSAAVSRLVATAVSFILSFIYLLFLPFHPWALAVLIGLSALIVILIGRPDAAITAAITTAVVLVVAAVSPHHAWQQPILRLFDTAVGIAVGVIVSYLDQRALRPHLHSSRSSEHHADKA